MLYYTAREAYRAVRRKYTLAYIIAMLGICLLGNIAMACFRSIYGMNDGAFASNLIMFAKGIFVVPYYSCVFLADIVFGKEYPNPYIKDKITKNLKRWQLYIGKFLATIALGVVLYVITFVMLVVTTVLFSYNAGSIGWYTVKDFLDASLLALPLWVAGISFGHMFLFLIKDKRKAFAAYYVMVLLIPRLIMFLAFESVNIQPFPILVKYLITPEFQALQFFFTMDIKACWIKGSIYTLISVVIGVLAFYKKKKFD